MDSATDLFARATTTFSFPKKFYAVLRGRQPGIYLSWPECKRQVDGYSGARYKGFQTREEVERVLGWRERYRV
jgi:ribonuclease HI